MAKKGKKLKSWQRRRRRRILITVRVILIIIVVIVAILCAKSMGFYEKVDLADYVTCEYSGYNTKGSVEVTLNDELTTNLMQRLRSKYDDAFIRFTKCESEDYNSFYNSLNVTVNAPEYLSNGSRYRYTVNYDKELAKKLRLKVYNNEKEMMVSTLPTATVLSLDQVFEGITFTFQGVSPNVSATMTDMTFNPLLSDVEFVVEGEKEVYSEGDVIRVRAVYDEAECLSKNLVIDAPAGECYKDYTVSADSHYIRSAAELPQEILNEAVRAANSAFTTKTAKEFGVRVYFEAGKSPVYVNKESTFEWVSYSPLSAYLKVMKDEYAGKNSNNYNDLDIVYSCMMTQADGQAVKLEAVVRFKDIVVNNDGTLDYDFSNATVSSASYLDSRIKKNVITNYEEKCNIEKLSLK